MLAIIGRECVKYYEIQNFDFYQDTGLLFSPATKTNTEKNYKSRRKYKFQELTTTIIIKSEPL